MNEYEFWNELGTIFDAVLSYQRKTMEFNKRFISPWIQLGSVFGQRDLTNETLQALKQATEIDPANAQNWAALGDALCKAGSYVDAVNAYQNAMGLNPSDGWTVSNLALALTEQGKFTEAIPLYHEGIELLKEPKDRAVALNRLGDVYRKVNDYGNAFLSFQKADQLEAGNGGPPVSANEPLVLPDLAGPTLDADEGNPDLDPEAVAVAIEGADTIDNAVPESDAAGNAPGESAIDVATAERGVDSNGSEESSEAIQVVLDSITESDQNDLETSEDLSVDELIGDLAIVEFAARNETEIANAALDGRPEAERVDVEVAVKEFSSSPASDAVELEEQPQIAAGEDSVVTVTVEERIAKSAYDEYLTDLLEPIRIHTSEPESPAIQTEAESVEDADNNPNSNSKDAHIWNELANVYLNSGRFDEAITACIKAISLDSSFGWAHSNLALAYTYTGENGEAVLHFQRSIELLADDKDKAIAWNRLGNLYRRQNDYENAIAAYQMADELDPESTSLSLRSRFNLLGSMTEQKTAYVS